MKPYFGGAFLLLSLSVAHGASISSAYENGAADPIPSPDIDIGSRFDDLQIKGTPAISPDSSSLTMIGAMSKLQKRDTILSLLKRSYSEMNANAIDLFPRQSTPPNNGNLGGGTNLDIAAWDSQVNIACEQPIANLSSLVTQITDPAGVAVCYNIPFYDMTSGMFASDIRLYKIANGTQEWEVPGIKMSLSVEYVGAMVQLAAPPNTGSAGAASPNTGNGKVKRETFAPKLLQTLRFVGQVNTDIMQNETMRNDPNLMKLLLIPTLNLVGINLAGAPMNASVAAAQVNYISGAFSNITAPEIVTPIAPFVLPGTAISIIPVGLYLFSVYMIFFLGIVGFGTWERYQFRMSYRNRASHMAGKTGVGRI